MIPIFEEETTVISESGKAFLKRRAETKPAVPEPAIVMRINAFSFIFSS
jgi:hypothetical protein